MLDMIDAPPWEGPITVAKKTPPNPVVQVPNFSFCVNPVPFILIEG